MPQSLIAKGFLGRTNCPGASGSEGTREMEVVFKMSRIVFRSYSTSSFDSSLSVFVISVESVTSCWASPSMLEMSHLERS